DGMIDGGETILQAKSTDNTYDSNSIANGTVVSVLVETTNGCTDSDSTAAIVYANPTADLQTSGVCAGASAVFTATPNGNGEQYTFWLDADSDGMIDGGETILQAKSTDNTYDSNSIANETVVSVMVETTNGCTDSDSTAAIVYANPIADIQTTSVCVGTDAIFTATPTGNGEQYTFWLDADSDGMIDGGETILQAKSNDNTYNSNTIANGTVVSVLVETTNGCMGYDSTAAIVENCGYGCTPGFWQGGKGKTLWDNSNDQIAQAVGFTTNTDISLVLPGVAGKCDIPSTLKMVDAITLGGGNCRKLIRHGVAAILNATTLAEYPLPTGINDVNALKAAIIAAVNNKCGCEPLASQLAANNELNHDLCGTITTDVIDQLKTNAELNTTAKRNEVGSFTASPVPFRDQLTVSYDLKFVTDVKIEVFNTKGLVVASNYDTNGYLNKSVLLNIPYTGQEEVYVIKLTTNRGSSTKKVISSR
ncbi:MAG TPA: T9SS type A sorting domain-containing protein, partial [Flavobacterium sp.]|uniref:T9SS type A sorting domain-containing protein n=1 Tax=Flavobacterium sp. TaxID=239 RepID=UPI002DBA9FAF